MKTPFRSFIRHNTNAHAQHQTLLQLLSLEEALVAAGLVRPSDQNTSLKSLYNLLYSSKPFAFLLHKAKLDIADNVPCDISLQFPRTHRVRLFKLCVLAVLHAHNGIFQAFVNSGYLKSINKRLVSVFTLFHLCLRSSPQIARLAIAMDPETKWPNPFFFASAENYAEGAILRKMSPFYPVHYATYTSFLLIKDPTRSFVDREAFVFPADLFCIRDDLAAFEHVATLHPHAIKLSSLAFYLTTSCKIGLKLFYYNAEVPHNALQYHTEKGNHDMVALIVEVRRGKGARATMSTETELDDPGEPKSQRTGEILKNLTWMRKYVWSEKDVGSFFHVSKTERAQRFIKKLDTKVKQHSIDKDYALLCVLKGIYKNKDVKGHNPMVFLFDAFGDLIKF